MNVSAMKNVCIAHFGGDTYITQAYYTKKMEYIRDLWTTVTDVAFFSIAFCFLPRQSQQGTKMSNNKKKALQLLKKKIHANMIWSKY